MDTDNLLRAKEFYQTLEESIGELPVEKRGDIYRQCAVNCVKDTVLNVHRQQLIECQCDLDLQYKKYGDSDYFFAKIIQKGHIYEIGYKKCTCHLVDSGFVRTPVHCECSRQSILYVLQELMPDKRIQAKVIETILSGADRCRFHVSID